MSLKEVFCQDKAVSTLQQGYRCGRGAHAFIFAGIEGVGKFKTACEWAKLLLCSEPAKDDDFADSCGRCPSCRSFEANSHPDFVHIYKELLEFTRDGKNKKPPLELPIDVIREFLIEKVSSRPALSSRKVFIIDEAEKLNRESQNALLKVLEEPPLYCTIILLCTRPETLFATIRSRCQIVRFGPVDAEKISASLIQAGLDAELARYFAALSQGSIGRAQSWASLELAGAALYETSKKLVAAITVIDYQQVLELAEFCVEKSKEIAKVWVELDKITSKTDINRRSQKIIVQIIISVLADAMRMNIAPRKALINISHKEQIKKLADRFNPEQICERIASAHRMLQWIDSAVNEKLIFEQLLFIITDSDKITSSAPN